MLNNPNFISFDIIKISTIIFIMAFLGFILYNLNKKLNFKKVNFKKSKTNETFEFGTTTIGNNVSISNTNFYIIGILFIILDIELIYLFPFSLLLSNYRLEYISTIMISTVIIFICLIVLGIFFELKHNIFNWYKDKK